MNNVKITCNWHDRSFVSSFTLDNSIPEYVIEDKAWQTAVLFAETIGREKWGSRLDPYYLAEILKELDYNYKVTEDDSNG